jgi:hypothetical protein
MFKRLGFLPAFMIVVLATVLGLRAAAASPLALTAAQSSPLAPPYAAETTDEQ